METRTTVVRTVAAFTKGQFFAELRDRPQQILG